MMVLLIGTDQINKKRTKQIKTKKSSENKTAELDLPLTQLQPNLDNAPNKQRKKGEKLKMKMQ